MAIARVSLSGAKEVRLALAKLETKAARKLASKALRAGAKIVQAHAKATAPAQTGALKRAIKVRAGKNRKTYRSIIVGPGAKWFTGDEFYAGFIEFGWKTGKRRDNWASVLNRISKQRWSEFKKAGKARRDTTLRGRQRDSIYREVSMEYKRGDIKVKPRTQIPGKHYMEQAYEATKQQALAKVMDTLKELTATKP